MLSDREGVDFTPYLSSVFKSINQHWLARMPVSVHLGASGQNSVTFRVMTDGSLPKEFLKLESGSGKDLLDELVCKQFRKLLRSNICLTSSPLHLSSSVQNSFTMSLRPQTNLSP